MPGRPDLAIRSLKGLSIGDAIGKALTNPATGAPILAPPPWRYTDDTEMAIAIVEVLDVHGVVDQDALAHGFAARFSARPERGYGAVAHWILTRIAEGQRWRKVASTPYSGSGSKGNGGAMRAGPLGAYFSGNVDLVIEQALLSAAVTHAHPQGQAGAVAVAVAAAHAISNPSSTVRDLATIGASVTDIELRRALEFASQLIWVPPREAGQALGTGSQVVALDTVPYALWAVFSNLGNLRAAVTTAIDGLVALDSDADTICAIVASIVALASRADSFPPEWLTAVEPLPPALEERYDASRTGPA